MEAKNRAEIDFDISSGYRTPEQQLKLYKACKSQLDGYKHKSKHNYEPAWAVDVYAYDGSKTSYEHWKLAYLAGIFYECAFDFGIKIKWGGTWIVDGKPFDMPHVELV